MKNLYWIRFVLFVSGRPSIKGVYESFQEKKKPQRRRQVDNFAVKDLPKIKKNNNINKNKNYKLETFLKKNFKKI